jgi:hypothetical protein
VDWEGHAAEGIFALGPRDKVGGCVCHVELRGFGTGPGSPGWGILPHPCCMTTRVHSRIRYASRQPCRPGRGQWLQQGPVLLTLLPHPSTHALPLWPRHRPPPRAPPPPPPPHL